MSVLNITNDIEFDNSITSKSFHTYLPYAGTSFGFNDEIRIPIQNSEIYTLPSSSHLYFEGVLTHPDGKIPASLKLVNNFICHLFDEIRYEIGGQVIDKVRNPGIAITLKNYISRNKLESDRLKNAGWSIDDDCIYKINNANGKFNVCVPLNILFGFCEDYKKILVNVRQELVLLRSNSDSNAIIDSTNAYKSEIKLNKILWKMPHVSVNDATRLNLLNIINKEMNVKIAFRSYEIAELPSVPQTTKHAWSIKSVNQLEKPRFIILAFQTGRKGITNKNASMFDHCKIANAKLYLNAQQYPYDNLQINYDIDQYATLYEMYSLFQESYYEKISEPLLDILQFKNIAPIIVIDCLHQNDDLSTGTVDIRMEFETISEIPANTTAYCLILHDQFFSYNALTGNIVKMPI